MEAFVEQNVSAGRDVFPRRELTRLEVDAKTGIVFSRFFNAVEVVALLTSTGFAYLSSTPAGQEPLGVVVDPQEPDGRVVFETPVLLPDEEFIAIDLIRGRTSRGRTRWKG